MVERTIELLSLRASPEVRGILDGMRGAACQADATSVLARGQEGRRRSAWMELQSLHREETAHLLGTLAFEGVMARFGAQGVENGLGRLGCGEQQGGTRAARIDLLVACGGEESQCLELARRGGIASPQTLALAAARLVPEPAHLLNAATADYQDGAAAAAQSSAQALLARPLEPRVRAGCLRLLALVARERGDWALALEHGCEAARCLPDDIHGWIAALQSAVRAGATGEAERIANRLAPRAAEVAAHGPHLLARGAGAGNERLHDAAALDARRRLADRHGEWTEEVFRVA